MEDQHYERVLIPYDQKSPFIPVGSLSITHILPYMNITLWYWYSSLDNFFVTISLLLTFVSSTYSAIIFSYIFYTIILWKINLVTHFIHTNMNIKIKFFLVCILLWIKFSAFSLLFPKHIQKMFRMNEKWYIFIIKLNIYKYVVVFFTILNCILADFAYDNFQKNDWNLKYIH